MIGYNFNDNYNNDYLEAYNEGYNDAISEIMDNNMYYDDYMESVPKDERYDYNKTGRYYNGYATSEMDNTWKDAEKFIKSISPSDNIKNISRQKMVSFYRKWKNKGSISELRHNSNVQNDLNKLQYDGMYKMRRLNHFSDAGAQKGRINSAQLAKNAKYDYRNMGGQRNRVDEDASIIRDKWRASRDEKRNLERNKY